MENLISKNIKYLKELNGLSQQKFADLIDKKRSVAGSYERGDAEPSIETLKKICQLFNVSLDDMVNVNFSEINPNIIGKTADETADETADKTAYLPKNINKSLNTDINFLKIEAIHVLENQGLTGRKVYISPEPAMASNPFSYVSDETEEDGLQFFWMPFLRKGGFYAAFRVDGQSMQGCIENGSWVVCRLLDDANQIRGGNIHLIATKSEGLVLKRIETSIPNTIICYSDNHIYSPFTLPNEEVVRVWAVESCLEQSFAFNSEKATLKLENFIENLSKRLNTY